MFFMPESPNWLLSKGMNSESNAALKRLRNPDSDLVKEMKLLQVSESSKKDEKFKLSSYSQRPHFQPLLLSFLLMVFQQFCGINAVMFYATNIFEEAHSAIPAKYATIIIGVAQVIATLTGSFLVDRLGRKILLIASGTLHVISTAAIAVYYMKTESSTENDYGWVPLVSLVIFIIGFSIGFGPIPWLMVAELTPMDSRSTTSAISTTTNWTCAFLLTKNFELLKDALTKHGTFFLFAAISFISILFTVFMLPETKGKSSSEIQDLFTSSRDRRRNNHKVELDRLD